MFYLVTNPFCPYCYINDRELEKEFLELNDLDILLLPMNLEPDLNKFNLELYHHYKISFENELLPYFKKQNYQAKYFRYECVGSSKLVFLTYYFLREFSLGLKFYQEISRKFYETNFDYSDVANLLPIVTSYGISQKNYLDALKDERFEKIYNENLEFVEKLNFEVVPSYYIDKTIYKDYQKAFELLRLKV